MRSGEFIKNGKHENFMERAICIIFFAVAAGGNGLSSDCAIGKDCLFSALQCHSVDGGTVQYSAVIFVCYCADDFSLFFAREEHAYPEYAILEDGGEYFLGDALCYAHNHDADVFR